MNGSFIHSFIHLAKVPETCLTRANLLILETKRDSYFD